MLLNNQVVPTKEQFVTLLGQMNLVHLSEYGTNH